MVSCLSLSDEGHTSYIHTPPTSPVTRKSHDSPRPPTEPQEDKENTPISSLPHTGDRSNEVTPTNQSLSRITNESPLNSVCESQSDDSLVVFPDKLGVKMTPRSADTRRLLRQQEMQLRALQEQVSTTSTLGLHQCTVCVHVGSDSLTVRYYNPSLNNISMYSELTLVTVNSCVACYTLSS